MHIQNSLLTIPIQLQREPNRSIFGRLLLKIRHAVNRIFAIICSCFSSSPLKLTRKDLRILNRDNQHPPAIIHQEKKLTKATLPLHHTAPIRHPGISFKEECRPKKFNDPLYQEANDVFQEHLTLAVKSILKEKFDPKILSLKKDLEQTAFWVKLVADAAVTLGDYSSQPIFEKLQDFDAQEKLKPHLKQFLKWLAPATKQPRLKEDLFVLLAKRFPEKSPHEVRQLVKPALQWLYSDRSQPLAAFFNAGISDDTIDAVYDETISLLVRNKIDLYENLFNEKVLDHFQAAMHETVLKNSQKIGGIIIHRAMDLLEQADWSYLCDETLHTINAFTENLVAAHQNGGGERDCAEVAYFPEIEALIKTSGASDKEIEEAYHMVFAPLVEELLDLLAPEKTIVLPDGTQHKVDGFVYLLNEIALPEEFTEFLQQSNLLTKEMLTDSAKRAGLNSLKSIYQQTQGHIESALLQQIKKALQNAILATLAKLLQKYAKPALIDELVAYEALPLVQNLILKELTRQILRTKQEYYLSFFDQLTSIGEDNEKARTKWLVKIADELRSDLDDECVEFKDEYQKMSPDDVRALVTPLILDIETYLRNEKKKRGSTDDDVLKTGLSAYFQMHLTHPDQIFGNLAENFIFQLGNFGATSGFFFKLIKGWVNQDIANVLTPLYQSPAIPLKSAASALKKRFLNESAVHALLFEDKIPKDKDVTKQKLNKEIEKTARIAHDLMMKKCTQIPFGYKPVAKYFVGHDYTHLAKVIQTIYTKTTAEPLLIHDLVAQIQYVALDVLCESAESIDKQESAHVVFAESVPGLVPACLQPSTAT